MSYNYDNNDSVHKVQTFTIGESSTSENQEIEYDFINSIFNENEKNLLDKDKDGQVSYQEVIDYVKELDFKKPKDTNTSSLLRKIASYINIEPTTTISGITDLIYPVLKRLQHLKLIDTDGNSKISQEELNRAGKGLKLYDMLGLPDGKYNNKQGSLGTCYLHAGATGIADFAPQRFSQIVKADAKGNTVVTFLGDSEKISYVIPREEILQKRIDYTAYKLSRQNTWSYKGMSSSPEGIALELAMKQYRQDMQEYNKAETIKAKMKSINESTMEQIKKPKVEQINIESLKNNSDLRKQLVGYILYCSKPEPHINKPDIKRLNLNQLGNMDDSICDEIINYLNNSSETAPSFPTEEDVINKTDKYRLFYRFAQVQSREVAIFRGMEESRLDGDINGGDPGYTIKLLAGGTYKNVKDSEDIKNAIKSFTPKSADGNIQLYTVDFNTKDETVIPQHAYLISSIEGPKVILKNPHDSSIEITYDMGKFLKNCKNLWINNLPNDET